MYIFCNKYLFFILVDVVIVNMREELFQKLKKIRKKFKKEGMQIYILLSCKILIKMPYGVCVYSYYTIYISNLHVNKKIKFT